MGFMDYLNSNVDKTIIKKAKTIESISEEKIKDDDTINIRHKLILELNRFGLNKEAISEIVINIFTDNKVNNKTVKKTSFTENAKKLKPTKVESFNPVDRASLILDGIDEMPNSESYINNNSNLNIAPQFNMNNTTDHASAILM